ncbi:uncharacterized protein LOC129567798 [Sitodiplosis mosellana]|uniref:uncharacterized protein LOC129567798 n=1 Tax=Sitodiplosis mosellana TaxID=263140 RepID=UPI00244408C4|nr:uncharacterized protein LOC129567798 [Sitodiplosis mosellana]
MEGEKFSWFAKNYLRKRPRLESTPFAEDQMASTSTCMPSTSSTTTRRVARQRILIEPSDEQLLKWQERQISECIVENTVNQMVESYLTFIEGENTNNGARNELEREAYHAYRAQENFEDSAIVWAIDQYGLQQHSQQFFNDNRTETMSTSSSSISLSSPPHLPSQDDLYFFKSSQDKNQDQAESKSASNSQAECSQEGECSKATENQVSEASDQGEKLNESAAEPHQSAAGQAINDEHFDFMEAAVAVAIQEKGLVSYSMQKSPNR